MHRLRSLLRPGVVAVSAALVFLLAYSVDTRAFSLDARRWPGTTNDYRIDTDTCTDPAWRDAINTAATEWTNLSYIDLTYNANSPNVVSCGVPPTDPTKLAITYPSYNVFDPYFRNFSIVINTRDFVWHTDPGIPPIGEYDMRTVMRHEFGHAIGLGHAATDFTLMHRSVESGRVFTINDDSKRGVDYYYAGVRWDVPSVVSEENFAIGLHDDAWSLWVGYVLPNWTTPQSCSYCTLAYRTYNNVSGATLWFAFHGNRVTYEFSQHPSRGNVEFYIDKNLVRTQNLYSANPIWGSMITFEVPDGNHILEVRKADASSAIYMDFDAFHVDVPRAETGASSMTFDDYNSNPYLRQHESPSYNDWLVSTSATGAWQNTTTYSSVTDASLSFTFQGSAVEYIFTKRNDRGIARVTIDGIRMADVDHYGPYPNAQHPNGLRLQRSPRYNLNPGTHTIVISVSGQKNPASVGYVVDLDALTIYR